MGAEEEQQGFIDELMGALGSDITDPNNADAVSEAAPSRTPVVRPKTPTPSDVQVPDESPAPTGSIDDVDPDYVDEDDEEELYEEEGEDEDEEDWEGDEGEGEEDDDNGEEDDSEEDEEDQGGELHQLLDSNRELMGQMNTLATTLLAQQRVQSGEGQIPTEEPGPQAPKIEDFLLTEDELDRVVDEPQIFNDALKRYGAALLGYVQQVGEAVPQTVERQVDTVTSVKQTVDGFYTKNPDLAKGGRKRFVQMVFQERLAKAQETGKPVDFDKLLNDTASNVRKELGLKPVKRVTNKKSSKRGAKSTGRTKKPKPTMPGTKSGRKGKGGKKKSDRSKQQTIMDEIIDL